MPQGGVQVNGLNQLVRDLLALGLDVQDLKQAFGKIANKAATAAQSFVPVRTGKLRSTIKPVIRKNYAGVKAGDRRHAYARVINYGYPKRNIKAAHFLQKADDAVKATVVNELEAEIASIIAAKGL